MGVMPSLSSLSNLDTVTEQGDGSFAPYPPLRHADPTRKTSGCPTNYRESLSSFGAAAQGDTSFSSCDLTPSDPTNKKPDARGVVDEPTVKPTVPKPAPKWPKSIPKSEFRGAPVCHSASLIMIKGKVAAEAVLFNSEPTPQSHFLGRALLGPPSALISQPQKFKEYMSPRFVIWLLTKRSLPGRCCDWDQWQTQGPCSWRRNHRCLQAQGFSPRGGRAFG